MSAETPIIEPSRLAQDVPDEFLTLAYDLTAQGMHGFGGISLADLGQFHATAVANGLNDEAQAHVIEATTHQGRRRAFGKVRDRIAETVGMTKMIRDYYKPDEEGLRVVTDPTNIHRVEVVGTPTVGLKVVKKGGSLPVELRVEAPRVARMTTSLDHVDFPVIGTGTYNFWNYPDAFPQQGESIVQRLVGIAFIGSVDAPRLDMVRSLTQEHSQDAINLLLIRAGVSAERLPDIPDEAVAHRRASLIRSFAERLIALEAGTAERNSEPMPLDDARFMLSVLKAKNSGPITFAEEVRGYIGAEFARVHKELMKGSATLDQDFALSTEQSVLSSILTTQFGRNGRFEALFAE